MHWKLPNSASVDYIGQCMCWLWGDGWWWRGGQVISSTQPSTCLQSCQNPCWCCACARVNNIYSTGGNIYCKWWVMPSEHPITSRASRRHGERWPAARPSRQHRPSHWYYYHFLSHPLCLTLAIRASNEGSRRLRETLLRHFAKRTLTPW